MKRDPKRAEQLRRAKRAQRRRERARGLVHVQITVPKRIAAKLRVAGRDPELPLRLERMLDEMVIRIADYPALAEIAWNLHVPFLLAREAFALYERNWRYVAPERLEPRERALIARLTERFGNGILHA